MRQPEISKAKLKCKTPVHYGSDKNLRDLKTPVGIKNGRWSPIKIHSSKSLRLFEVCVILNVKYYKIIFLNSICERILEIENYGYTR